MSPCFQKRIDCIIDTEWPTQDSTAARTRHEVSRHYIPDSIPTHLEHLLARLHAVSPSFSKVSQARALTSSSVPVPSYAVSASRPEVGRCQDPLSQNPLHRVNSASEHALILSLQVLAPGRGSSAFICVNKNTVSLRESLQEFI